MSPVRLCRILTLVVVALMLSVGWAAAQSSVVVQCPGSHNGDAIPDPTCTAEALPEIDGALDRLFEVYGSSVPLADLLYADPYRTLMEHVESGFVVGKNSVDGTPCHHLAFMQEGLDWQIWIADGPRPVPLRLVITYVDEPGAPQYIAELSKWDFQPRLSDHYFTFRPPADSDEIEFLPPQERFESNKEEN